MKKIIINMVSILLVIIPLIVLLKISSLGEEKVQNINLIILCVLELINIVIMIYCLAVEDKKKKIICIIAIYIIITMLIPIYDLEYTYAPTGSHSELMGLAIKKEKINMYGIKLNDLYEIFK